MKRRECASLIILALAAVPALLVAIGQVYVTGVDGIRLRRTETIYLLTEIAVLFFLYLSRSGKLNRTGSGQVRYFSSQPDFSGSIRHSRR